MDLRDAFCVSLPADCARLTVGELLDRVFGEDDEGRRAIVDSLDVAANPDLPDMHRELVEVVRLWRAGRCELAVYVNCGPRIALAESAGKHVVQSVDGAAVLDLVLEQTFEPLAWFARQGGDAEDLLGWLRGCVLLYFMDKHGFELSPEPDVRTRRCGWLPIAEELRERGLVAVPEDGGALVITGEGRATWAS